MIKPSTSKLIDSTLCHIKRKSVMKACWTDMYCNCWGEHWIGVPPPPALLDVLTRSLSSVVGVAFVLAEKFKRVFERDAHALRGKENRTYTVFLAFLATRTINIANHKSSILINLLA